MENDGKSCIKCDADGKIPEKSCKVDILKQKCYIKWEMRGSGIVNTDRSIERSRMVQGFDRKVWNQPGSSKMKKFVSP